eukprot:m.352360 g.352360  ORF g.352360 m.352360 type:complete len:54 (+) comp16497_c0_seq1:133-294(+)
MMQVSQVLLLACSEDVLRVGFQHGGESKIVEGVKVKSKMWADWQQKHVATSCT